MSKIAARDWIFQIADTDGVTYLDIDELTKWDCDPGENEEVTEGTSFPSAGAWEGQVMQRGASMELEGFRSQDPDTGILDPGQARVEALGVAVGVDSVGKLRFRYTTDTSWTVWNVIVKLSSFGGGNNDFTPWGASFTRTGAASTAAVA